MVRAYHFLSEDLRSDEDMIAGNSVPWRIAETRAFTPVAIDAGNEEIISEIGYRSSPTLGMRFCRRTGQLLVWWRFLRSFLSRGMLTLGWLSLVELEGFSWREKSAQSCARSRRIVRNGSYIFMKGNFLATIGLAVRFRLLATLRAGGLVRQSFERR